MSRVPVFAFSILAAGAAVALPAYGQAVISTRSGLIHYFEGSVYVAGQPLQARLGKFTSIPEGAELRTEQGRAEVLLTPGVFLRIGEKSTVRMVANALQDTRVELLAGSVMVDSGEPAAGTSVTLIYQGWNAHQAEKGLYRIDAQPPRLEVRQGEVDVAATGGTPVQVQQGEDLPLAQVLVPEKSAVDPPDALGEWAEGRAEAVATDNAIAANIQDPATMTGLDLPGDDFTYFPMLGLSMLGPSPLGADGSLGSYQSALYGGTGLYQPGFYSLYLPGYTYRPMFLRLPSSIGLSGLHSLYPSSPYRGILPVTSPYRSTLPGSTLPRSPGVRAVTPSVPHGGVHIGHR